MRTRSRAVALALQVILIGGLTACIDDADDDGAAVEADQASGGGDTNGGDAAPDDGEEDAADENSGTCAGTDVTYTGPDGATLDVTSTLAVSRDSDSAVNFYLADFELSPDDISLLSAPEPGAGETLVTLFVTAFNAPEVLPALEAGQEVEYTDDFEVLTFRVTGQVGGEELAGNNVDAEGTVTITAVGDTFCAEVDYQDAEKSLSGTIEAPATVL